MFISGMLSAQDLLNLQLPCGFDDGCAKVKELPASHLGPVPIAVLGFAMYLLLAVLAFMRLSKADAKGGTLRLSLGLAGLGTLASVGLQAYSLSQFKICSWCLAHAITITIAFVLYGLQAQRAQGAATAVEAGAPKRTSLRAVDIGLIAVLGVGMVFALQQQIANLKSSDVSKVNLPKGVDPVAFLVPEDAHSLGPPDAVLTIVEFGDLCCPMCMKLYNELKPYLERNSNTVRYVFRHFPLYMTHQHSPSASALAEYAGEKGQFWAFIDKVYSIDPEQIKDIEPYLTILSGMNIDKDLAKEAMLDKDSAAFNRMYRDLEAGDRMGLRSTPTFFFILKGKEPEVVGGNQLWDKLESEPYKSAVKGGG